MKKVKWMWWIYVTLTAVFTIFAATTYYLYWESSFVVAIIMILALAVVKVVRGEKMDLHKIKWWLIASIILASGTFFVTRPLAMYGIIYEGEKEPRTMNWQVDILLPYTYDVEYFNKTHKVAIKKGGKERVVFMKLPEDKIMVVQSGFIDQDDFIGQVQRKADRVNSKFFDLSKEKQDQFLNRAFKFYGLEVLENCE